MFCCRHLIVLKSDKQNDVKSDAVYWILLVGPLLETDDRTEEEISHVYESVLFLQVMQSVAFLFQNERVTAY
jgi:hypothetical protein